MKNFLIVTALASCLVSISGTLAAAAQESGPPFPVSLEKELAARASNYTEVSMDKKMLAFAGKFMSGEDEETRRLVAKLEGVYVREYDFDTPGQYTAADLERIRVQFKGSEWTSMVRERSRKGQGDTDIYLKMVDGKMQGLFVLDAQAKELDFIYIAGAVDPADLSKLDGNFGIPKNIGGLPARESGK